MGSMAGWKAFLVGAALLAGSQVSGATLTVVISDVRSDVGAGGNCDAAAAIGKVIAEKASAAGIKRVRLDR